MSENGHTFWMLSGLTPSFEGTHDQCRDHLESVWQFIEGDKKYNARIRCNRRLNKLPDALKMVPTLFDVLVRNSGSFSIHHCGLERQWSRVPGAISFQVAINKLINFKEVECNVTQPEGLSIDNY